MTARDTPTVAALLRLEAEMRLVTGDLRSTRIEHGLSQAQVSRSASISVDQLSRIERNLVELQGIPHLAAVAAVLGMRLKVALYPEGEPLRDRVQVPGLAAFDLGCTRRWPSEPRSCCRPMVIGERGTRSSSTRTEGGPESNGSVASAGSTACCEGRTRSSATTPASAQWCS